MSPIALAALVLLAGTVLAMVLRENPRRAWAAIVTQAVACVLVLVTALPVLFGGGELRETAGWSYPIETIAVRLDALSAFFLVWSLPMTLLGTIYASGYLRPEYQTRNAGPQYALLNLIALSFVMVYTLESAFPFLLGWEIAAVAAWLLVIWNYRNQKIRFAGFNYLVSTHIGLFVLLAAFMIMYSETGSMDFTAFAEFLRVPGRLRNVTFVLLVTSFGLKSAFFPFHTWLPRAHSAAPAHVSALMSGVIHKAGLFGMLRFLGMMGRPEEWMGWYVIVFSATSAVIGVLYTMAQRDLKRLLGYSSTENVGIAGIGFGVGMLGLCWKTPELVVLGFTGGTLHLVNHALFKCLLFYGAGAVQRATHSVNLERLGGLARRMPWTAGLFLLGCLASAALPPLNGFVSELLVYAGLLGGAPHGGERAVLVAVAALLAFVGGVAALAVTRCFGLAFLGAPRDRDVHAAGEAGWRMRGPMLVHGVAIVVLGLFPGVGLALVREPVALLAAPLGELPDVVPSALWPIVWVGGLLLGIIALLLALRWLLARGAPAPAPRHVTWGCGYPGVSPRMQYTGTSFSAELVGMFEAVLPQRRREQLPAGPLPERSSHLHTTCVDAVERRMFEVIGDGDDMVTRVAERIPEEPRFSFGVGVLVLAVLVGLAFSSGGL